MDETMTDDAWMEKFVPATNPEPEQVPQAA